MNGICPGKTKPEKEGERLAGFSPPFRILGHKAALKKWKYGLYYRGMHREEEIPYAQQEKNQ